MNRPLVMKQPNVCIIVILSERVAVCVHVLSVVVLLLQLK